MSDGMRRCGACGAPLEGNQRCSFCQADQAPDAPVQTLQERRAFEALLQDLKKLSDAKAALRLEQHPLPRDPSVALDLAQHLLKLSRSTAERQELQSASAQNVAAALRDQLAGYVGEMSDSERKRYQSFEVAFLRTAREERFHTGLGLFFFLLLPLGLIGILALLLRS